MKLQDEITTGGIRRTGMPLLTALALTLLSAFLFADHAGAGEVPPAETQASGAVKIQLSGKTAKQMRKRGLRLQGKRGAKMRGRTLSLPVRGGEVTKLAKVRLGGVVKIVSKPKAKRGKRAKKRRVTLGRFGGVVIAGDGNLVATIKGSQVTLLTLSNVGDQPFNPVSGEIKLRKAGATLTPSAISAIAAALGGAKLPKRLGKLSVDGNVPVKPTESTNATVRVRPAGAVDLVDAEMTWRPRESFVNYIHSAGGGDGGAFAVAPAMPGPAEPIVDSGTGEPIVPSPGDRVYEFDLPFEGGWYDQASAAVNVELAGGVRFAKPDYGIDLDAMDPVVELGGDAPRVIADLRGRASTSDQDGRTALAVDLDQAAIAPETEAVPGGTRYTYEDIPARVPDGPTAWVLATYYSVGSPWGEVSVSYTVPND